MKRLLGALRLMLVMMKTGFFTFGGGYAMISMLHSEFTQKHTYLTNDEFMDVVAVAESTPGPIAINMATYIGYKRCGFIGAILSTFGMCAPSFVVIFLISLFFDRFLEITWVKNAFHGIQIEVIYIILSAGVKMLRELKKSPFNIVILCACATLMVLFSLFSVSFSAVFYILISGGLGLVIFLIKYIKERRGGK